MSMLSERSLQRVHVKGKQVAEHSSYHYCRYSTNFKRTNIEAGNLLQTGVEISRNSKVDGNVVVQAETSRIVEPNGHRMPAVPLGKANDLELVGSKAKSDKMTARHAFHASNKSTTLSCPISLASSHSHPERRAFEGKDLPPAKAGVLTDSVSQLEPKSLDGPLKINNKQDFSSSVRKLDKNDSTGIAALDQNKLKRVSGDETCRVAQRKTSLKYPQKSMDDEDELFFSSHEGQNCDRAKHFSDKMSSSQRESFNFNAMAKHQSKSVPEPTEGQQKSKNVLIMESAGSGVSKLNALLDVALISQSNNLSTIPSDECQEVGSRDKVFKALKQFKELYTQLLEKWERVPKGQRTGTYRADLKAAKVLKKEGKWINCSPYIGNVPGVQIGDCFRYRVELAIIGLHHEYVCGIHYEEIDGKICATSVVDSGRYHNMTISTDEFFYIGEGGNPEVSSGLKDQTLDGGNLALKNSMDSGRPVRVIRGRQSLKASNAMGINTGSSFTFFYDGLFIVTECVYCKDPDLDKKVFRFRMERVKGDPNFSQPIHTQNKTMPTAAVKGVKTSTFTCNFKPKSCYNRTYTRHSSFACKNKDEKFDHEAAAHLAIPVVSNRRLYANRTATMLN